MARFAAITWSLVAYALEMAMASSEASVRERPSASASFFDSSAYWTRLLHGRVHRADRDRAGDRGHDLALHRVPRFADRRGVGLGLRRRGAGLLVDALHGLAHGGGDALRLGEVLVGGRLHLGVELRGVGGDPRAVDALGHGLTP
jgi:hypothetical protein